MKGLGVLKMASETAPSPRTPQEDSRTPHEAPRKTGDTGRGVGGWAGRKTGDTGWGG